MLEHSSDRDVAYWTSSRLSGEWSSLDTFGPRLTKEILESLISQFQRLEPMIRVRLLLSTLFIPRDRLRELRPQLRHLAEAAEAEDDEWVRVFGLAVGKFDGRLDIGAVKDEFPLVETTLQQLEEEIKQAQKGLGFRPLEENFLSHRLQRQRGLEPGQEPPPHCHFRLREGAALSIRRMLDDEQRQAETLGASAASTPRALSRAVGASVPPENDMFMDTNPVKENVTIAGLGSLGRVDSRRTGRIKQLDVSEAIAAQELSRQMSDAAALQAKTPRFPALLSMDVYRMRAALPHRAARNPSRDGEEPLSATTPSESAACNPFLSGDAFAPLHLPPAGKRGREWEQEGGGYDPAGVAPLIKDALVELGGEEGEAVQGLLPAGLPQTEGGGSEVNYF